MSIQQLETIWTEQPARILRASLVRKQRHLQRSIARSRRKIKAVVRSQYYLTSALNDGVKALRLNEDITIACLICMCVLAFSASSILTHAIYQFILSAAVLSTMLGASMIGLVVLAICVLTVSMLWLMALLQNLLSISLMDGATRKRKRTLLSTFRRSLHHAPGTALAWASLLAAALAPAGALLIAATATVLITKPSSVISVSLFGGAGMASLAWITYVLANYSLLPYTMLYASSRDWRQALQHSRTLVSRKGRLFVLSSYAALGATIALIGVFSQFIGVVSKTNSIPLFCLDIAYALFVHNACLTMLYRKRRLARK